jgi:hypothetical protein
MPDPLIDQRGVNAVEAVLLNELGWAFCEQPVRDFGIDAQVEVIESANLTGKLIALQIKTGAPYFRPYGAGYIYYGEQRHLDYWLGHSLPVFVILHDPNRNLTLWKWIERHLVRVTDKGWSLVIPSANILSVASKAIFESAAEGIPPTFPPYAVRGVAVMFMTPNGVRNSYHDLGGETGAGLSITLRISKSVQPMLACIMRAAALPNGSIEPPRRCDRGGDILARSSPAIPPHSVIDIASWLCQTGIEVHMTIDPLLRATRRVQAILDPILSLALIIGVIAAVSQLFEITRQTKLQSDTLRLNQQLESAKLVLQFRDRIESRFSRLTTEIENYDQSHALVKRADGGKGGPFSDIEVESYLGTFEDMGYLVRDNLIFGQMAYRSFSYDIEKAWCNADVQRVIHDARRADKSVTAKSDPIYGSFEILAGEYLAKENQSCKDLDKQ